MTISRIFVLMTLVAIIGGCKSPLLQSDSSDEGNSDTTMKEWQNKSYQRDQSVLKTGSDKRARDIEERLGVNRETSLFR